MHAKIHNSNKGLAPFLTDKNLGFPHRPCIAPDLRLFDMPDGLGVQVRGGEYNTVLRGLRMATVWPWLSMLLDGSHTVEEILRSKPAAVSDTDVLNTLWVAFTKGVLVEGDKSGVRSQQTTDAVLSRQSLFWGRKLGLTRVSSHPEHVQAMLASTNIALFGNGLLSAVTLDILKRSGFRSVNLADWADGSIWPETQASDQAGSPETLTATCKSLDALSQWLNELTPAPDLLITATRDVPGAVFELINRHCMQSNIRWLRGHDDLVHIEIGPFVDPFSSACYTCMLLRQMSCVDHPVEEELYQQHLSEDQESGSGGLGECLAFSTAGAGLLATEAIRIVTAIAPPSTENCVITVDFKGSVTTNRFLKVPRCPDCYCGSHSATLDAR